MNQNKRSPDPIDHSHHEGNAKLEEILRKGRPVLPPMSNLNNTQKKEAIETNTTIKFISNSAPIEVVPPEIIINDVESNQTYEVVVLVRNLTNIGRRIRVYQPKTNKFRCDYDMQGNVAAGLAMKLVVSFETDKSGDFHDVLEIVSDNGFSLTVPLHAYQPQANVAFDPFINFGFIRIQKEEIRPILFENQGKKEGRVDLKFDGNNELAIMPNSFVIKQGERKEVFLKYTPKEAGIFRGTIEVSVEGQSLLKHIDVSATSVDYFIFMVDKNGAQSQNFDFGDIYFGQFKEIEGFLVNNSPQKFNFKAKFLTGLQNNAGDLFSLQTPFDLGQEQIQRIMTCWPSEGVIDSYSQVPIKFSCKSRVTEEMIFWTRNFCMRKEKFDDDKHGGGEYGVEQRFEPTNYSYTCIFEFDGKNDLSPYIHLSAKGICPTVKISHHLINFGECKVHDRRDYLVTLENKNDEHTVEFNFANVAHFKVAPKTAKLQPNASQKLVFTFEPKSLGKFSNFMDLELFSIYKIPVKLMGSSLSLSEKKIPKRGPECTAEDFAPSRKFVTDDNIDYASKRVKKGDRLIFTSLESTSGNLANLEGTNISDKLDLYYTQKTNKDKYNTYIKEQRLKRLDKPKELVRNQRFELTNDKLEELIPNKEFFLAKDKEEGQIIHPLDFDFIYGTETIPMDRPKYALPDPRDPLFVTKPLGHYEPNSSGKVEVFRPDPTKTYKKIFPAEPASQAELRDILKELNAEELQKIFVGPTTIDFGIVYVKSKVSKFFAVKNNLKTAIVVQISVNNGELGDSFQRPQIIPPMQTAGFEISFYSMNLQSFKGSAKYVINGKHEFYFAVNAQVEPVKLVLENNQIAFKFQEKDEDMEITNQMTITNKGNAPGNFKWDVPPTSIFKVSPLKGEVQAEGTFKVSITYCPSGVNFKGESERLGMQVENGETQYLNCIGYVNEAKCEFREQAVDFGSVLVSQEQPKAVYLKNKHKTTAVFKVNPRLPPGITVTPLVGRIPPDSHAELRVAVFSNDERTINEDILVSIRGGKQARLPVKAKVIIPQVKIVEEEFDFGGVTYGSTTTLKMTLVNESSISAVLNLDLTDENEHPGIQYLEVLPESEPGDDESSFILSVNQDQNKSGNQGLDDESALSVSDSDEEQEEKETMRNFNIKIKENGTLNFILKFTPNDAKGYNFELPIRLQGYGKIDALTRYVTCRGLRPRCIIDPPMLEFKKKTITSFDKPLPDYEKIILTNMDHTKPITWKLDTKSIDEDRAFTITPTQGKIDPGQQMSVTVGFSPVNPGQYEKIVHLYLDKDMTKPYGSITLKGLGDFPKLLFDRREIVLPIVPIDVESRCTFKIINDGYENLTLKYEIANDVGNIGKDFLKLEFPEGKNLGVTKPKLKIDAVFKSKKPLSFTVELNFIDDNKHVYRIKISGTTDNCLFTNFPYLQRNVGEFEILAQDKKPLYIQEIDNEDSEISPKAFSMGVSKSGSTTSRAGRGLLGYTPIPQRELERASECIKNWLNQNVLSSYISKFPSDVIELNGQPIYDLIQFLTGKNPAAKASLTVVTKKTEKIKALHKQYDDLIKVLKENGALLNTIRPEYLLRHTDYNTYLKVQDNQYLIPSMQKLTENKFNYLSIDAWTTLFYQILKIYFLGKVNLKHFRATPGMPAEKLNVPDYYLDGSNLIGAGENLLLRWLEVHYEKIKPGISKRLKGFGEDLRDGHVFAAVIQSYVGNNASKSLSQMRNNLTGKDDYLFNASKIIGALEELGLQTPFTAKDLEFPSQREIILFCLYLYNNLPHYIPKATIEFACVLRDTAVKYIELSNPAHKAISYRVHLEGDADFSLENTEERDTHVHLEPKTSLKFPIKYTARLSKPVTGRILFTNKREEGNIQAAALVFDIKSKVTGRRSEGTETFQTRLYEMKTKDLKVENLFNMKADFQVELTYQKIVPPETDKKKRSVVPASKGKTPAKAEVKVDDFFMPFATRITTLTVPRLGSASIPISFLPFTMETHTCHIVFRDDKVGEIQYTLVGEVDLPPPVEVPTVGVFYLDSDMRFQAAINVHNHILQNARKLHIERLPQAQKAREQEKEKILRQHERTFDSITFDIEAMSQFLNLPQSFTLATNQGKGGKGNDKDKDKGTANSATIKKKNETSFDSKLSENAVASLAASALENRLNIGLNFKAPTKDQPLRFIFRSQNKVDIRVYEVKVTVLPKPIRAILEMRCPAGELLTQDVPVKNDSDKDWNIKAQLVTDTGRNGTFFSGGKDFRVPKNSTGNYTIQFKPPWMVSAEAKLILTNPYNGQQYDFDLRGYGEEPLAEGHVVLECKARKTKSHIFRIKNEFDKKVTYRVETDLYNASGKNNFEVLPGKTEEYVMDVTPMLGGAYTGSITFYDDYGRYRWWTIEVHTESPKSEKTIDLSTIIRKAIAFDISISNPLEKAVTFEVIMRGEGLFGENAFTLLPKQTGVYELVFSPLKPMKETGSIAFIHEELGEIWYELNLASEETQAIRLTTLRAELGKAEYHEVELENPSHKEVHVKPRLSNPHNFDIIPEDIVIQPYDSAIVQIRYMPSDLDVIESCEIVFETEDIGKWSYLAFGQGIPPTKFDVMNVSGSLNRDSSSMINFKNPFKDPISVSITLDANEETKKVFEILLKKTKITIGGLNVIQIPVSFLPRAISDYYAELVITMNEKISWRYPLRGVTESYSTSSDFYLRTKCRVRHETELKINLPGNPHINPDEHYTLELMNIPKEYEKILQNPNHKALVFTPLKDSLKSQGEALVYKVIFQPLKPFKASLDIAIVKSTGGRWKYKLYLESTQPDPDDTISITSPINKTSSISFKLTNYTKYGAEFNAGFSAESDSEFTIFPKAGILEPYGKEREGTNFIVSFTPIEYGKSKTGKLVIQTDEMYWSYNLRGVFPKYVVPKINSTRIENRLSEDIAKKLSSGKISRNFLVENIRKSSHSPKKNRDRTNSRSRSRSPPPREYTNETQISPSINNLQTPKK